MLHGKNNFTDIIKFMKLKTRLSPVLQMGPVYLTEPVTAKRFLSSWVQRDVVEKREAVETFRSGGGLSITAGLVRDYESENAGGLWKQRMMPG